MGDLSATTALEEAPLAKKPKLETAPSTAEQLGTVGSDAVFNKLATSAPADGVSGLSVAMQAGPLAKKPKVETAPSSTEQLKLIVAETQLDQSVRLGRSFLTPPEAETSEPWRIFLRMAGPLLSKARAMMARRR